VALVEQEKISIKTAMTDLRNKVSGLPDSPGVYLFKDARDKIIYVGKAKSLKKRAQSYFGRFLSSKTQALVAKISDIEYVITPSESQAQILEAALIKNKQPQYNISLKDDKSFPSIKITQEEFPLVSICHNKNRKADKKSWYFGPYTNAKLLGQAFKVIRRIFGFRSCRKMPKNPCLYYRVNLCPAPCAGKINPGQYRQIINQIKMFLDSRQDDLLFVLATKMQKASSNRDFERAAKIRDQIDALAVIGQNGSYPAGLDETQDLKKLFGLNKLPQRIEAFDISNISGKQPCGSMVSFYRGLPDKKNYRRFRIKTVRVVDDYGMLKEIIRRRYQRLLEEGRGLPDFILIDGGKAHLRAAQDIINNLRLNIPIASIAKDRENLYLKGKNEPIKLGSDTRGLNLIRRIRDEAHRFAIVYHHLLHRKKTFE
jgi:excinuclease ABC subunit C